MAQQSLTQEPSTHSDNILLFYPELLGITALGDLGFALNHLSSQPDPPKKVHIFSFFSSVWALQELKSHPLFPICHFYTLSLNDKFKEYPMLQVMEALGTDE
jgi:hypothetical protein